MKILKHVDTPESYLLQSADEALKINFLLRQMVYFRKGSPLFDIIGLNHWSEAEDIDNHGATILDRAKLLAAHLKIEFDSKVSVFGNTDDTSCFLLKKSGKCIQVDRKFNSLCDESDSLFLNNNYNMSKPEKISLPLFNAYYEIFNMQEDFIYSFRNNERTLY